MNVAFYKLAIVGIFLCFEFHSQTLNFTDNKSNKLTFQKNDFDNNVNVFKHSSDIKSFHSASLLKIKPRSNSNYYIEMIKEKIAPLVSYKTGGVIVNNADSIFVRSFELGAGLTTGTVNEWISWGALPMGFDWAYYTLPYLTIEYRWFNRFYQFDPSINEPINLQKFMLNLGVSGGKGGILTLLPVPIAINGSASLSTDFKDLYFRGRVGWDIAWVSIGIGGIFNLTKKSTANFNSNYSFLEIAFHPWRDN